MPVVTVQSLPPPDPARIERLLTDVAAAVAQAIACSTADVWVYWEPVTAVRSGDERRTFAGHSPIVSIRARAWRPDEHVRAGLAAAAAAVAGALQVPVEDVWVHWLELPPGRVYSGGEVR